MRIHKTVHGQIDKQDYAINQEVSMQVNFSHRQRKVLAGHCYLLVDDFVGQGGTLANLRAHIAFQINILAQTSEVLKTSEVFRTWHFSETLYHTRQ